MVNTVTPVLTLFWLCFWTVDQTMKNSNVNSKRKEEVLILLPPLNKNKEEWIKFAFIHYFSLWDIVSIWATVIFFFRKVFSNKMPSDSTLQLSCRDKDGWSPSYWVYLTVFLNTNIVKNKKIWIFKSMGGFAGNKDGLCTVVFFGP